MEKSKEEMKWKYKLHSEALADTGDYNSWVTFTNGKEIFQSSSEEMEESDLQKFCDYLNMMPDLWSHKLDAAEFELSQLKNAAQQTEPLKAENERLKKERVIILPTDNQIQEWIDNFLTDSDPSDIYKFRNWILKIQPVTPTSNTDESLKAELAYWKELAGLHKYYISASQRYNSSLSSDDYKSLDDTYQSLQNFLSQTQPPEQEKKEEVKERDVIGNYELIEIENELYIISHEDIAKSYKGMVVYKNGDGSGNLKSRVAPYIYASSGAKYLIIAATKVPLFEDHIFLIPSYVAGFLKLQHQPQQESGWISVKDRLPETGEEVNCYNKKYKIGYPYMYYEEDSKKWFDSNYVENAMYDHPPTHWFPVAELPKLP